jgi:hypothetical protein
LRRDAVATENVRKLEIPSLGSISGIGGFLETSLDSTDCSFGKTIALRVISGGCPVVNKVAKEQLLDLSKELSSIVSDYLSRGPIARVDSKVHPVGNLCRILADEGKSFNVLAEVLNANENVARASEAGRVGSKEVKTPAIHETFDGKRMQDWLGSIEGSLDLVTGCTLRHYCSHIVPKV